MTTKEALRRWLDIAALARMMNDQELLAHALREVEAMQRELDRLALLPVNR
jgi:hypothetical protein